MKRFTFLLVTSVLIAGASIRAQETGPNTTTDPQSWKRYTVEGEEFSVILPTLPAMTTTKAMRKRDHEYQVQRQIETSQGGLLYTVEVYENPKPKQSLAEFISERRDDIKCDPASERAVTVDGYSGKECSSSDKDYPVIVQFLATETHSYCFLVRGSSVKEARAPKEFFSSIRLGTNPDGIKISDGPGDRIYTGKETDKKVRLLVKPPPSYIPDARANKVTGTVILRVVFTSYGTVENIRVIRGLPNGLTELAIEAAKKIKFVPATKYGYPVSMWMQLEYNFSP
jgi:TonB family protein